MPWVRIDLSSGRTETQKRQAAVAITEALVRFCGCPPESVSIVFQDVDNGNWASGGRLLSDPKPETR